MSQPWRVVFATDVLPAEVVPVGDLREHVIERACWCKPRDEDGVVVHNALDGRERYEVGQRWLN